LSSQDGVLAPREQLPPLFLEEDFTAADAHRLEQWLKLQRPDAVIATHAKLSNLLAKIDVRVPRDLAVAALSVLDGNFDAGVDQNSVEVGRVAFRTLAGLVHQNERGIPLYCRRVLVEGRWIDGSSVPLRNKPAPKKSRPPQASGR
jgi:hypothetical protein